MCFFCFFEIIYMMSFCLLTPFSKAFLLFCELSLRHQVEHSHNTHCDQRNQLDHTRGILAHPYRSPCLVCVGKSPLPFLQCGSKILIVTFHFFIFCQIKSYKFIQGYSRLFFCDALC